MAGRSLPFIRLTVVRLGFSRSIIFEIVEVRLKRSRHPWPAGFAVDDHDDGIADAVLRMQHEATSIDRPRVLGRDRVKDPPEEAAETCRVLRERSEYRVSGVG